MRTFEEVLALVNARGRWQWQTRALTYVVQLFGSVLFYQQTYLLAGKMHYRCADADAPAFDRTAPLDADADQCYHEDGTTACLRWNFSSPYYESSIVSEFALVCERAYLVPTYKSLLLVGYFCGIAAAGAVADRFGRRPTALVILPAVLGCTFALALSHSLALLLLMRFLWGLVGCGMYMCLFVLNMELSIPADRNFISVLFATNFPLAGAIASGIGLVEGDWRRMHLYVAAVSLLVFAVAFRLPESPRWLITNERYREAWRELRRGARLNRRSLPLSLDLVAVHDAHADEKETARKTSFLDLFGTAEMRLTTVTMATQWVVIAMVFYGIMFFAADSLPGSPYIRLVFIGIARIVAMPVQVYAMNRLGKRLLMACVWVLGAALFAVLAFLPTDSVLNSVLPVSTITSVLLIIIFDTGFSGVYTFTGELYPTVLRQSGLSLCSMMARIGAGSAPFITDLLGALWPPLPAAVMMLACLVAALLLPLVPEMNRRRLPDSLRDAQRLRSCPTTTGAALVPLATTEPVPEEEST